MRDKFDQVFDLLRERRVFEVLGLVGVHGVVARLGVDSGICCRHSLCNVGMMKDILKVESLSNIEGEAIYTCRKYTRSSM